MRIVLTGGGTGGHVMPFEPMVQSLRTLWLHQKDSLPKRLETDELRIYFVGVADQATRDFFAHYDVPVVHVPSGKLRRYASLLTVTDLLFRLPLGVGLALVQMWRLMPEVVVSKGGFGSMPTVLAAAFYRIPVLLHESDAVFGLANSFLLRFATAAAVGWPAAKEMAPKKRQHKIVVTGTPVRHSLFSLTQAEAKQRLHIAAQKKVVLLMGGSQGAQQINEQLMHILPRLVLTATVIHVTGEKHFASVSEVARQLLAQSSRQDAYRAYPFVQEDDLVAVLAAADAVVSRAGSAVAELIALRKPMLLIPLDSAAADHQRANARVLEQAGAALVLDPTNVGANLLEQNITRLLTDEQLRANLRANMARIDFPQAATTLAKLVFALAQGLEPAK